MRGLVVEFERINYGTGDRVRFASLSVNVQRSRRRVLYTYHFSFTFGVVR